MQQFKDSLNLNTLLIFSLSLTMVFALAACNNEPEVIDLTEAPENKRKQQKETMMSLNKEIVRLEEQYIENYIQRHGLNTKTMDNGIRYEIYKKNPGGQSVEQGDKVEIRYSSNLLTGKEIDKSDSLFTKTFAVANSNEIQGLHWAVMAMREQERGIFIIPNNLAYGITGEKGKIPHSAALVYDIRLTNVNKKGD